MIAIDTNILVYAHREELPQHLQAKRYLMKLAEGSNRFAIPIFCIGEFLRVITHVKLWNPPFSASEACVTLENLLLSPSVQVLMPGPLYVNLLLENIQQSQVTGNLLFDAQIAALCLEHGVRYLVTEDRDFARFRALSTKSLSQLLGQ